MQLFYGTYGFDSNSTEFSTDLELLYNAGGQAYATRQRVDVKGYLSGLGQDLLTLAQSALQNALVPFRDLVLYNDDGTPSATYLRNLGSISGVRILNLRFPTTNGPEYATIRSFELTAEAEYPLASSSSLLLSFTEKLSFSGGLPIYAHRLAINGPPQKQLVYPATPYVVTQEGRAEGYRGYPTPPVPKWPFALKQAGQVQRESPERKGSGYQRYPVSWRYEFEAAGPLVGLPTLWVS